MEEPQVERNIDEGENDYGCRLLTQLKKTEYILNPLLVEIPTNINVAGSFSVVFSRYPVFSAQLSGTAIQPIGHQMMNGCIAAPRNT